MAYSNRTLRHGNDRMLAATWTVNNATGKAVFNKPKFFTGLVGMDALEDSTEDTIIYAEIVCA